MGNWLLNKRNCWIFCLFVLWTWVFLHLGDVWGGWEICPLLRKWRKWSCEGKWTAINKMSPPIGVFSRKLWGSKGSENQFPQALGTLCSLGSRHPTLKTTSLNSPLFKPQFLGSEEGGWIRSSPSISATEKDLTSLLSSLLSYFLVAVSLLLRLICFFCCFSHAFLKLRSLTIVFNFFLSRCFSFCQ